MFVSLLLNNLALFTVLCIGLGTLFADMDTGPRLALVPSPTSVGDCKSWWPPAPGMAWC